jgi:hypothetical protein
MVETSPPYDLTKKRPLAIRVLDHLDEGGVSEQELRETREHQVSADALFLIRVLFNDDQSFAMEVMSIVGETHDRMSVPALFDMWVRLAAYIVRDARPDGNEAENLRQRKFCLSILQKLLLDENLQRLVAGLESTLPVVSGTEEPRVEPSPQSDEPVCGNG